MRLTVTKEGWEYLCMLDFNALAYVVRDADGDTVLMIEIPFIEEGYEILEIITGEKK